MAETIMLKVVWTMHTNVLATRTGVRRLGLTIVVVHSHWISSVGLG